MLDSEGETLSASLAYKTRQLVGNLALWQATKECLCGERWPTLSFMKKGRNANGTKPGGAYSPSLEFTERKMEGWREEFPVQEPVGQPLMCAHMCMADSRIPEDSKTQGSPRFISRNAGAWLTLRGGALLLRPTAAATELTSKTTFYLG